MLHSLRNLFARKPERKAAKETCGFVVFHQRKGESSSEETSEVLKRDSNEKFATAYLSPPKFLS